MRLRHAVVNLRMKPEEKEAWQQRAEIAGMTLADFIRQKVDGADSVDRSPKKRRMGRKADPLLLASLGRVGSNLNQLARWANTYKEASEAQEIILALVAIEQAILSFHPQLLIPVEPVGSVSDVK